MAFATPKGEHFGKPLITFPTLTMIGVPARKDGLVGIALNASVQRGSPGLHTLRRITSPTTSTPFVPTWASVTRALGPANASLLFMVKPANIWPVVAG